MFGNFVFLQVTVANEMLYVVGGYIKQKTVERYDPKTKKWSTMCSLNQKMDDFSYRCNTLRDKVVVCYDEHIEIYNPVTNEWLKIVSFEPINLDSTFLYLGKLLTTEFIEN